MNQRQRTIAMIVLAALAAGLLAATPMAQVAGPKKLAMIVGHEPMPMRVMLCGRERGAAWLRRKASVR